jgi:AraC-like DNA-binding protein
MQQFDELGDLIDRHCRGMIDITAIPRVMLSRSDCLTAAIPAVYQPMVCIVAQGAKRASLGEKVFEYNPANYLITSVALPLSGAVCCATKTEPYLALGLELDCAQLASLAIGMPAPVGVSPNAAIAVHSLNTDLLDPIVRLLRLLDHPQDVSTLAPLIEREILYRLLQGEQSAMLRQIAVPDSRLGQVHRAAQWINQHYAQPFEIAELAADCGMSPSSLHRHFKAVTGVSPLQYQKRIRLQQARHMLVAQQRDVGSIAFSVGYESPSQFSREYARLFGMPPAKDASELRKAGRYSA